MKLIFTLLLALLCVPAFAQDQGESALLLASGGGGGSVPSVVQSVTTGDASRDDLMTTGAALTVGNILVVLQYGGSFGSTLTSTDTKGNTFTVLASGGLTSDGDAEAISCAPITTGGIDQIDLFSNGSRTVQRAVAYEVANATCTQDVTAAHTNTSGVTSCSASITTSTANDFIAGLCGNDGTNTSLLTTGTGWSGAVTATPLVMGEYQVGTSPGAFTFRSSTFPAEEQGSVVVALQHK